MKGIEFTEEDQKIFERMTQELAQNTAFSDEDIKVFERMKKELQAEDFCK